MAEDRTSPREAGEADHGRRVASMFGRIARWYDFLNHSLSLGQDVIWRRRLVRRLRLPENGMLLDLACGTMDVTLEALRQYPGARVAALDFSGPMLARGRDKAAAAGKAAVVVPALADGRCLPLPDASVDAASIAFGIRNILPREQAFCEIFRVLRPGGRLCVLEFGTGKARIWKGVYNLYLDRLLPMAGRLVSGDAQAYRYLADTIRAFPSARELAAEMTASGFSEVFWQPFLSGIVYVHVARKAPEAAG
ncbi:Ubiquinone/menaquinone biosynthesis methyltransferase ubiE [Desulfovibrio sp. X2]|uniref:ubiquinone/menaquinone biosynthesis methyltransferase n=1 Tax=Desulfovibrio sp. X2 TaxID=941449 RepID=UPI000358CC89|nr:ubiquinone/menaquinone biosynthesis methyltransferase [Desulfovibrio sp. X2]EPR44734.1 Ubiquinone/menaquinone biosynthesis methyltransferase ubiE [Desulfovibrio sp. X2]